MPRPDIRTHGGCGQVGHPALHFGIEDLVAENRQESLQGLRSLRTGQARLRGSGWLRARPIADPREIVRVVMNRILALLVVPIIACWMVTIPVIAQTTSGSISGTVTDASRAGIPGARVTAVSTQTGAQRASVTGGDGRYQLPGLPPGIYDLRVEKEGFNTIIQQGIVLQVTQDAVLNVALRVGIVKQEFTVSAAPPLLDTTNAQVSGVVT